jgi:Asp/Glu/hydantoin racemase
MRRLLIVNPNTNTTVTGWLAEEARRIAKGAFEVVAINAKSKIAAIQTPEDVEMAARAVVAALSIAPEAGYSAAIIAAFGDPGLEHARALGLMAVAGLGEAGMLAAAQGGRRFSIVTLGAAMREPILARASALGLQKQLVDVHVLPFSIPEMIANRDGRRGEIAAAVRACEGEAALLGGAPFAGMAAEIARLTDRVVLDGVEASIRTFNFE